MPKARKHERHRRGAPAKDALTHGTTLADAGAVTFTDTAAGDTHATVHDDGTQYEVRVAGDAEVSFSPMSWSCPCTPDGGLCGHVVAVALTLYRQHAQVPVQREQKRASG